MDSNQGHLDGVELRAEVRLGFHGFELSHFEDGFEARPSGMDSKHGLWMDSNHYVADGFERWRLKHFHGFEVIRGTSLEFSLMDSTLGDSNHWETNSRLCPSLASMISWAYELGLTRDLECCSIWPCLTCLINCSPIRTRTNFIDIHSDPCV